MFRGLINDVKSAAGSLVAKYLVRLSIAVPFLIAFGFATAAITMMLVDRYGAIVAYWIVTAGFVVIGLVAAMIVSGKEHVEQVADVQAEQNDTREVATDAVAQAAAQAPLALMGALLTTPGAASALLGGARVLGRNIPLVVLLAAIGLLMWPSQESPADGAAAGDVDTPDDIGLKPAPYASPNGLHRDAA